MTVDHSKVSGTSDLVNFPLLVSLTDVALKDTVHAGHVGQADGGDILFTASDGSTKLQHEIESYDPTTGKLVAWVRVPTLEHDVDTDLYLYYGNGSAADQWNLAGVWDLTFTGVWHLDEQVTNEASAADVHVDSTSNGHPGDQYGNDDAPGKVSQGQSLDGGNDRILIQNITPATTAITVSAWVRNTDHVFADGYANYIVTKSPYGARRGMTS